jgi:hypothetical protein
MKEFDLILPHIMANAPGCAVPMAERYIREAAIEFCTRTKLWRYEDDFDVTGTDAEAIMAPYGACVLDIERALFDGQPLEPKTTAWLDENALGWRTGDLTGTPRYLTQTEPNTIRLVPAGAGHVHLYLWLVPSQEAEDLPDFIVDQHTLTIAHGALGNILAIPNQAFTDREMAGAFAASFEVRLNKLSSKGITGQQRARVRTKSSMF